MLKFSSANAFNFHQSKILSLRKELSERELRTFYYSKYRPLAQKYMSCLQLPVDYALVVLEYDDKITKTPSILLIGAAGKYSTSSFSTLLDDNFLTNG